MGVLSKAKRLEITGSGLKSATVKVNKHGKKSFSGTKSLKASGQLCLKGWLHS